MIDRAGFMRGNAGVGGKNTSDKMKQTIRFIEGTTYGKWSRD